MDDELETSTSSEAGAAEAGVSPANVPREADAVATTAAARSLDLNDVQELSGEELEALARDLHLHLHPAIFKILMEDSEKLGIRHLRLTRDCLSRSRKMSRGHWLYRVSHAAIFEFLSSRARKTLEARQIRHAQITFGLLQNAHVDEDYILKLLPELPPGDSELYSHPSLGEFKHEFDALVSPRVVEQIKKLGIELIRYQDL